MIIKQYLLLGLLVVVVQANAYRVDYHDAPVRHLDGPCYQADKYYWVHTEYFNRKIGKTIRHVDYITGSTHHAVDLHIWYPNALDVNEIFLFAPYRRNDLEARRKALLKRGFSYEDIFKLNDLYCYASDNGPFSSRELCPMIFFCIGNLGTSASDYTGICEKLASEGYVVVAIERQHELSKDDVDCAYYALAKYNRKKSDMFYNQLDFERVGIIGHLHGGSLAYTLCREDRRFKAGVSMDGLPFGAGDLCELYGPFKFLFSEFTYQKNHVLQEILKRRLITQVLHAETVIIPQLKPQGFSDLVILKDLPPYNINKHLLDLEAMTGAVPGEETLKLINKHIVDFFKKCLT